MILIDHVLPSATSSSGHDQRSQGAVRDAQAGLDALLGAAPDRVLVLDREHDVEPALVEGVDDPGPVDLPETRHPAPPPAPRPPAPPPPAAPGVGPPPRPPGPAVAVAPLRKDLDVLGLGVRDAVDVRAQGLDRVDAHPHQV